MEQSFGIINQPKTWFIDLDGTIVKHNGYKMGEDELLTESKNFFDNLNKNDYIVITTARKKEFEKMTVDFLIKNNIRFDLILFDLPTGERLLINDKKPDGTKTAYSININRNEGIKINFL
jgi:FMN phosphatase YigB (HAD superfamily)